MACRILFVDDEPGIRATLPAILNLHGFEVTSKATVAEALLAIASSTFDVLISDLNVGQPGDGFTVVSAMRRTQPECLTLILTGYPAFAAALEAIRSQVDDYLVKPMPVPELVDAIEKRITSVGRKSRRQKASKRISEVIRKNIAEIVRRTLVATKVEPELAAIPIKDEQRVYPNPRLLVELAEMLESTVPNLMRHKSSQTAAGLQGQARRSQGYSIPLLVASLRLLESAIYEVIAENLLALDTGFIISDIKRLSSSLTWQLEETIWAYQQAGRRLVFDSSEKWSGWFCERCCWNRRVPSSESERAALAVKIYAEFDAHSCELFALEHRVPRA